MKAEQLLGLTPVIKRIAYHYLLRGVGEYPVDHPHYDKIIVRPLYDFRENPEVVGEHAGGLCVEFYRNAQRIRWVDFRCQVVGGGGAPIVRTV